MPVAALEHTHTSVHSLGAFAALAVRPLALALFVAALFMVAPAPVTEGATTNILVGDSWFCSAGFQGGVCPTTITVGDTVSWDFNSASFAHTTTDCGGNCSVGPFGAVWDSGTISGGGTFQHTFNSAGVFPYLCTLHSPFMRGTITVTGPVGGVSSLSSLDASAVGDAETGESLFGVGWAMGVAAAGTAALGATLLVGRRRWLR